MIWSCFHVLLIAHEVGHAFGLRHTFEYNQTAIDEDYQKAIQKLENDKKEQLSSKKKNVDGKKNNLKAILYDRLEKEFIDAKNNFKFVKNSSLSDIDRIISTDYKNRKIDFENQGREKAVLTNEQKELKFKNMREALDNKRLRELEKTLNLEQSSTEENFMDYKLGQRKSFWYWQWIEMHCNKQPLKEHIL
ncbi:hypothetical protein NBRC110019_25280 [Neptunitalea chrysea]|uniref:Uncharacterized protein n=1 Tax=Neptunitalea chrysea TaxID=1647581 RepID=A0A9W6B8G2_9FLAO|nr:hypothetical protein [Neptunitalea chrysea]GLB53487.1 hypothetical protein NBRC110019_25280 [Neptunitalea chrysea]